MSKEFSKEVSEEYCKEVEEIITEVSSGKSRFCYEKLVRKHSSPPWWLTVWDGRWMVGGGWAGWWAGW